MLVQMMALWFKMALRREVLWSKINYTAKSSSVSRTPGLRCLKFGMQLCLEVLHQICSNGSPPDLKWHRFRGAGFEPKKYTKNYSNYSSKSLGSGAGNSV